MSWLSLLSLLYIKKKNQRIIKRKLIRISCRIVMLPRLCKNTLFSINLFFEWFYLCLPLEVGRISQIPIEICDSGAFRTRFNIKICLDLSFWSWFKLKSILIYCLIWDLRRLKILIKILNILKFRFSVYDKLIWWIT